MNSGGFCHVLASKRRRMSNLPLYIRAVFSLFTVYTVHKQTGMKAFEGLRFLASLGLPGTSKRKGGEKMQPFNRFLSHPGIKRKSRKRTFSDIAPEKFVLGTIPLDQSDSC